VIFYLALLLHLYFHYLYILIIRLMAKKYFYIILFFFTLFSLDIQSQEVKGTETNRTQQPTIEGLTIYPNPVNSGKIYISSKSSLDKKVEIFDVLGKKVLEIILTTKEVNVSNLSAGVYIIKIKEGESSATRKLIIN
jgi:hypothetical protein